MKSRKAPTPIHILVEGENKRTYLNCKFRAIQVRMINLWEQNPAKLQDKLANVPVHAQIVVIATVFNDIYGYLCTDGEIFKLLINK